MGPSSFAVNSCVVVEKSPKGYIEELKDSDLSPKTVEALSIALKGETSGWVEEFIKRGGVNQLHKIFKKIVEIPVYVISFFRGMWLSTWPHPSH